MADQTSDDATVQHNLNESADKITLKTRLVRGTATRDQDKHDLKVRAETPEKAASDLDALVRELEEQDVFERMRAVENEAEEGED
jgi:hypothetical protein